MIFERGNGYPVCPKGGGDGKVSLALILFKKIARFRPI